MQSNYENKLIESDTTLESIKQAEEACEHSIKVKANRERVRSFIKDTISRRMTSFARIPTELEEELPRERAMTFPRLNLSRSLRKGIVEHSATIWDHLEQKRKLGQGAHCVVKYCIERETDRPYAVKIYRNADDEVQSTLKSHFNLVSALAHPSLPKIQSLYILHSECYLVMEYCSFRNVRALMEQVPSLSRLQALRIIKALLEVVYYLHSLKIVHRDIKPENILYDPFTDTLKLIDLDLCKEQIGNKAESLLWTNTGTTYYKAPEMFAGGYGEKVDVWAVGIMAYQLIFGKLPFSSEYLKDTIQLIKQASLEIPNGASSKLSSLLSKCLAKDPDMRCTTKEALAIVQEIIQEEELEWRFSQF